MNIDYLKVILSPPNNASETSGKGGWHGVEARLGTALPDDYKEFISAYGSGRIGGFLWVFNPFSTNENLNLEQQSVIQGMVLNELKSYGEDVPYKPYPDMGGILPFGITDNGDVLFWETEGEPNGWKVVVNAARSPDWQTFDQSMSWFLADVLTRKLNCTIFPTSFPEAHVQFEASP